MLFRISPNIRSKAAAFLLPLVLSVNIAYAGPQKEPDSGSIFRFDNARFAAFSPKKSSAASYYEADTEVILSNAYYSIAFDKNNGGIRYIEDVKAQDKASFGSLNSQTWKLDTYGGKTLKNTDFSTDSQTKRFSYKWSGSVLRLSYDDKDSGIKVENRVTAKAGDYFDIETVIINNGEKPVIAFFLPYNITFPVNKLERFVFPTQLGIALKPGFFLSRKSIFDNNYVFSDFVCWESKAGNIGIYTIQDSEGPWTEPEYNFGYNNAFGGVGVYSYKLLTYVAKGQTWKSPKIRFRIGESALEAAYYYSRDNNIGGGKSLKDKLGSKLFDSLSKSVMLKLDFNWISRKFNEVGEFVKTLPSPTLIHIVTFWNKAFDQNYPDYLPPNPKYGTQQDLRDFSDAVHKQGMLLMPYTNPTWWNESETVNRLGRENIAVKKLDGKVVDESYWNGKNWGIAVSPNHPDVVARTKQTVKEFTEDIPCDILFEDQLGARFGMYDLNPKAKSPVGYKQGLIDTAKQGSKKIPIMLEAGYDGLLPYSVGFCGCTVNDTLPPDTFYDMRFGEGNWEIFPLALYLAHDKVGFYHHNLAHEVFVDNKAKLTWTLAYGYGMFGGYWPKDWEGGQKKWFYVIDAMQKKVASRYFGKRLTDYERISDSVTLSVFEDIAILANHSQKDAFDIEGNTLAPAGFMAKTEDGKLTAGLFTRFSGDILAGEHFIITEAKDKSIEVSQPEPKHTLITIVRPSGWNDSARIHAYLGDKEVPLALTPLKMTFFYDSPDISGHYRIAYEDRAPDSVNVIFNILPQRIPLGEKLKVAVIAQNKTGKEIKGGKVTFTYWTVPPYGPVPSSVFSEEIASLPSGQQARAEFELKAPDNADEGSILWIKAEFSYSDKGAAVISQGQTKVNLIPQPIEVHLRPAGVRVLAGETGRFEVSIRNNSAEPKKVALSVESGLPENMVSLSESGLEIAANEEKTVNLALTSSGKEAGKVFPVAVNAAFGSKSVVSETSSFAVESPFSRIALGPNYVLRKGIAEKVEVSVETDKLSKGQGQVKLIVPSGWEVSPASVSFDFAQSQIQKLSFDVKASAAGKADISAEISLDNNVSRIGAPFFAVDKGQAALIEADVNGDGQTDLVLGNDLVEVQATTAIGGRILAFYLKENGNNLLYTAYPNVKMVPGDSVWAEYGGINDWFPEGWPGDIWNNIWKYRIIKSGPDAAAVELTTKAKNGLTLSRTMELKAGSQELELSYAVANPTDKKLKYVWCNHPDLAPGPQDDAVSEDMIIVPTQKEVVRKDFGGSLSKFEYPPSEGWCLAQNSSTGEYFAQKFDLRLVDKIGVWEGSGFFTMELLSKPVELEPGKEAGFGIRYIGGKGKWDGASR